MVNPIFSLIYSNSDFRIFKYTFEDHISKCLRFVCPTYMECTVAIQISIFENTPPSLKQVKRAIITTFMGIRLTLN